jgi:anti-sigma-K factor RskA
MTDPRALGGLTCDEADDLAPAFVLGALESGEADAVRRHLAACPESHAAFVAFGDTAAALALLPQPIDPPAPLRDRLMAAVKVDLSAAVAASAPVAPVREPEPVSIDAERIRRRPRTLVGTVMAAAAVVLILVLGASTVVLRGQVNDAAQQALLLREVLVAAAQPGARVASVSGTDAQPGASGFVVLPADGSGYLAVDGLIEPPPGQTYQAWTIGADGLPVPAGLASPTDGLVVFVLPPSPTAKVVALTLEPAGGSTTPTMPIQAAGELRG